MTVEAKGGVLGQMAIGGKASEQVDEEIEGTAVTLAPLLDAQDRGYVAGVLQSYEMGYGVYARMGFTEQFRYHS